MQPTVAAHCRTLFIALGLALLAARPAAAHGLGAQCRVRGGQVEVEAYYDDDTPATQARVVVRGPGNETVAEGRTDAAGRWSFPLPPAGTYRVTVDAGAGHRKGVRVIIPGEPVAGETAVVSAGPGRREFTRFPWLEAAAGIGAIGGLGLVLWFVRHKPRGPAGR
jgi:hypothetical protein